MYATIDEAHCALRTAALDVAADFGDDAVDAAWSDLVRSIAACCPNDVAAELLQREGLS